MAAATLLTDAFNAAKAYWLANALGTRAGLIADLVAKIGVTQSKAASWVDAITTEVFQLGVSDDTTYATFKARLLSIGATRAGNAVNCAFDNLRKGALVQDSRNEAVAMIDQLMAEVGAELSRLLSAKASVEAQPSSVVRDSLLVAIATHQLKLERKIASYLVSRERALVS